MKWTGMNFWAAVITWFRIPSGERRVTVSAAMIAMGVFAVAFGVIVGLVWLFVRL